MKNNSNYFVVQLILLISTGLSGQVGIGTTVPDISSALDISSSSKGFLMPRLSTEERSNILLPANGLMVYNTTLNDGQLNIGTPLAPKWKGIKGQGPMIDCVTENDSISTISNSDLLVPGMTISPQPGTYLVFFNGQHKVGYCPALFTSDQAVIDMFGIYQALSALPVGTPHALVFGNGEVLSPDVYDVTGAPSIAGTLTLDGGGDTSSVFIIRGAGAFSTAAGSTIELINGASSNNIFWMSEAALSTAAGTTMKGTMISPAGALSLGANTNLEGRMFTKLGTITMGADCIITAPAAPSPIELGVLSTLVLFSSSGAVSDVVTCMTTGDVGTAFGPLTITGTHIGEQYPAGTTATPTPIPTTTYSIYQNGDEVLSSSRKINSESAVVTLQSIVTTLTEEAIEIRWKVDSGEVTLNHRVLSLIRSEF